MASCFVSPMNIISSLLHGGNLVDDGQVDMEISTVRCLGKQIVQIKGISRTVDCYPIKRTPQAATKNTVSAIRSHQPHQVKRLSKKCRVWRTFSMPASLEESSWLEANGKFIDDENPSEDVEEEEEHLLSRPLSKVELQALQSDSERRKLITKLSEANQQNRFLKRQLYVKEDALLNFKSELAVMELEVQHLVSLAEEIAKAGIPVGSRKINGKYIQSHLLLRLEGIHRKLQEQIKGVGGAQSKEVHLFWTGVAESVQVMGSFDGWSQGEHMSPEYTGYYTKFSTTLMLRPGRYEIKFLVDGEWHLSTEFATVGEGLTKNNLLIVE